MPQRTAAGIIKLLHKGNERDILPNWRPITLLTLMYKINAKIMAGRMKPLVPDLVDSEQTGFAGGRSIQDNLLTFKLCQELAIKLKRAAAFMKVDFIKAYDKLELKFLWDTLLAMGFDVDVVNIIKGLVESGTSKVHFNGMFTDKICLSWGVRLGCPLALILFALSTQPFMAILNNLADKGKINRLKIGVNQEVLLQLFADHTGLFFEADE